MGDHLRVRMKIHVLIAHRLLISRGGGMPGAVRAFFKFGPDTLASPSALRFTPSPTDPCPPRVPRVPPAPPDRPRPRPRPRLKLLLVVDAFGEVKSSMPVALATSGLFVSVLGLEVELLMPVTVLVASAISGLSVLGTVVFWRA